MTMPDLRDRFDAKDLIPAPDLWPEIERRHPADGRGERSNVRLLRDGTPRRSGRDVARRALAIAAAIALVAASFALLQRALPHAPAHRPTGLPSAPPHVTKGTFAKVHGWITFAVAGGIDAIDPNDPTHQVRLVADTLSVRPIAWSADGTRLLFVRARPQHEVGDLVVRRDDGTQVTIAAGVPNLGASGGSFTPDGTRVVYAKQGNIYEVRSDGGSPRLLAKARGLGVGDTFTDAVLSPDGTRIAALITSRSSSYAAIWTMSASGHPLHHAREVTSAPAGIDGLAWSPDGTRLAFGSTFDPNEGRIVVVGSDGSDRTNLTHPGPGDREGTPAWSPDGARIAFSSSADGLVVIDADGTGRRVLGIRGDPVWNPVP
jgi:dipeptidyl aminopeptidase/acylaminoacyl peptidase